MSLRTRLYHVLEADLPGDRLAAVVRVGLGALIVVNVAAVVLETVPGLRGWSPELFATIETASVAIFTVEYLLRMWAACEDPRYSAPLSGRLRWALSVPALIDLAAILPSWLPATAFDLRSVRLLRLVRIVRVAKLGRYSRAIQTLQDVVRAKAADLGSLLFVLLMLLVVASTLMFFFEHEAQPGVFSSIPATMWWGIVTLTTVGYGDMTPQTDPGRVLGAVIAIMGIGMFALPAGLLGAAFVGELERSKAAQAAAAACPPLAAPDARCPHCGGALV